MSEQEVREEVHAFFAAQIFLDGCVFDYEVLEHSTDHGALEEIGDGAQVLVCHQSMDGPVVLLRRQLVVVEVKGALVLVLLLLTEVN